MFSLKRNLIFSIACGPFWVNHNPNNHYRRPYRTLKPVSKVALPKHKCGCVHSMWQRKFRNKFAIVAVNRFCIVDWFSIGRDTRWQPVVLNAPSHQHAVSRAKSRLKWTKNHQRLPTVRAICGLSRAMVRHKWCGMNRHSPTMLALHVWLSVRAIVPGKHCCGAFMTSHTLLQMRLEIRQRAASKCPFYPNSVRNWPIQLAARKCAKIGVPAANSRSAKLAVIQDFVSPSQFPNFIRAVQKASGDQQQTRRNHSFIHRAQVSVFDKL